MKILWLVNIVLPPLEIYLGRKPSIFGGWLTGALRAVQESDNELVVCTTEKHSEKMGHYQVDGVSYYITERTDIPAMRDAFQTILETEKPDVIHIYGTEYEHSWAMAQICDPERTVVTIQGALTCYEPVTYGGLPERVCRDNYLHKILRKLRKGGSSIELQKLQFAERMQYEKLTLQRLKYINGGSGWGNAVAKSINPDCITFDCGLILRDGFYTDQKWSLEKCEPHSIYVLMSYPIKGFHKFLEILPTIVRRFPDTKVYVAASRLNRRSYSFPKAQIMDLAPDYQWLIQRQIDRLNIGDHLIFLGPLSEDKVKETLLKSNVFVSPAIIENQSTALGEAMILGVPSVASGVGAIMEMISHGQDGFIYPFGEPYLMAEYICQIFEDPDLARRFSKYGIGHASRTYDREENGRKLLQMYQTILDNSASSPEGIGDRMQY